MTLPSNARRPISQVPTFLHAILLLAGFSIVFVIRGERPTTNGPCGSEVNPTRERGASWLGAVFGQAGAIGG